MQSSARKFNDVFSKLSVSKNISNVLANAEVEKIKINKSTCKMEVFLRNNEIINDNYLKDFEIQLKKQIPVLNDVQVNLFYKISETNPEKIISMYWNNILNTVLLESPICHKILSNSKWVVSKNILTVFLKKNSLFLFSKKGIRNIIQSKLDRQLNLGLRLVFENESIDDKSVTKYEQNFIEKQNEMILHALKESGEVSPNKPDTLQKPEKTIQKQKSSSSKDFVDFKGKKGRRKTKVNNDLSGKILSLSENLQEDNEILVEGHIIDFEVRETKSGNNLVTFDMTDKTNSITIKFFTAKEEWEEFKHLIKKGNLVIVKGKVQYDEFSKELNIMAWEIGESKQILAERMDDSAQKRVELHLHTQMSSMDGINSVKDYIKRAAKWGHKAIAITDHGVVQAFPEAMEAAKGTGVKIIYGVEAYLVDDLGAVVQCPRGQTVSDKFVIFDLETTGLSKDNDKIIEIGAVKVENGLITDTFSTFVNPKISISSNITKLTSIDNSMVKDAPTIDEVLPNFLKFAGESVLVAHNANFDVGFITTAGKTIGLEINNTVVDTLELSRTLFPELNKHKLNIVAEYLGISLENHHRAVDDAQATAEIFIKCIDILKQKNINTLEEINILASETIDKKKLKSYHSIILAKNYSGLKNLYELVSKAHIQYFFKRPRIPKSEYLKLKEGLIIGTACEAGEFYKAVRDDKPDDYIRQLSEFYDYFEIQPVANNMYMVRNGQLSSAQQLVNINKKIVSLGEKYNKPVIATCDVHFMEPEDEIFRRIIMFGEGFKDADNQAPLYYRTTEEMLKEFEYLGKEKANEVVITNTNLIADMIDELKPIPDETFPPFIEGAEEELVEITTMKAKELYGENLPKIVEDRLEKELNSIIKNGFAVLYIIAQKLVWKSMEDGYLVGSRGSVGSSFVATMAGITEVNPLPPHYYCPNCKFTDFDSEIVREFAGASGCDMPDRKCPNCRTNLGKEGHDIPFETFLGFDGDKEPDIDLNFSGEYQAKAHAYTEELFGSGNVFKAGTIGTLADKTAYGYVKKYFDEKNASLRNAEINRLKIGCTGIKRTTGQHPGGLMVLPNGHSIYEFCPIQRPANDTKSNVTTTHFDYHSISGRLLKLDLLGHDVPTIVRMLHDMTGIDPRTVDLGDKSVMSLFTSPEALGIKAEDINCKTGSLGLPEFGTNFVRNMLLDTKPNTFAELVRISGLSHGTDVWLNNAQELVRENIATLKEVIPTRDDIMVYLINKGVERKAAFKIMENVRKGKGLKKEEEDIMLEANVPKWYIDSCKKIKYMFPKGHAVAYVMMTVRIGYFKIYHPYSFYAASFSVKSEDFDYELMCKGKEVVLQEIGRINSLGKDVSTKEKGTLTILELVLEMYERGLKFVELDLYKSDAFKFKVTTDGLLPPLCSVQGLGANVAQNIVEARKDGEFVTIENFRERTKTNKTVIELLKKNNILNGIPETNQLCLF